MRPSPELLASLKRVIVQILQLQGQNARLLTNDVVASTIREFVDENTSGASRFERWQYFLSVCTYLQTELEGQVDPGFWSRILDGTCGVFLIAPLFLQLCLAHVLCHPTRHQRSASHRTYPNACLGAAST